MDIKNIVIVGMGMVIILLVIYVSVSIPEVVEKDSVVHKNATTHTSQAPKESLRVPMNASTKEIVKAAPSDKVVRSVADSSEVSEPVSIENAKQKEYGTLSIRERNSLSDEDRLSKLDELIDTWETMPSSTQKKITNKIRMQWKTLPQEDQEIIQSAWQEYQSQQRLENPQKPRTTVEIKESLKKRMEARNNGEKLFK